ncbi:Lysine histidine transporter 1 [Toxocara canis]|uniref:Lysine histidine transporter 1 n=1 Tax=Toxocara canis TaxID=6265 RepID=A0A0B2W1P7_TOXCA|nr:Lysine histidine transporter 1 [Toxocara canis]
MMSIFEGKDHVIVIDNEDGVVMTALYISSSRRLNMASQKIRMSMVSITTMESSTTSVTNHQNDRGLHWLVTALFLVGDLAGGGLVTLPTAMMQSDFYSGLAFTFLMTAVVIYTAYLLGQSWVMLQRRWPEYRDHCRKPYPEMGARAMGPLMKLVVTICIDITQFGIAVVYVLLSSKNIHDFLEAFFVTDFSFCYVVLVMGVCLLPVTFLKSPKDFWAVVVVGMVTTACAVVLILIGSALDYGTCAPEMGENVKFVPTNYFLALGTLLFAYGGHAAFPTIQHDMRKPYHFTRSIFLTFGIITLLYTPVCVMGYITYGNSLQSSIINSIQTIGIQQAINILITAHCILTLTIVFNPLNQDIEELFDVPHLAGSTSLGGRPSGDVDFCWQRVFVRTGVMIMVIFVAESLPTFGPLLDLVGGSTLTLTALVFPCFFYLYLSVAEEKTNEKDNDMFDDNPPTFMEVIEKAPKLRLFICGFIILFGIIGGAAATYSAISELVTTQFTVPCYIQPFTSRLHPTDVHGHTNCCGKWQNITTRGDSSICGPYVDFYNQRY